MTEKSTNPYGDIIFSCTILLIAAVLLIYLQTRPPLPEFATQEPVGPYAFSRMLLIGIIVVSAYLVLKTVLSIRKNKKGAAFAELFKVDDKMKITLLAAALLLVYIMLIQLMGFTLTTFLWLSIVFYIFGTKSVTKVLAISLPFTAVLNYVFITLLHIVFPRGIGIFYNISRFLGQ